MPDKENFNAVIVPMMENIPKCFGVDAYNHAMTGDVAATLNANSGESPTHSDPTVICIEGNGSRDSHMGDGYKESDTMYTLNTVEQHAVAYGLDRASFNQGKNAQYDFSVEEEKAQPLVARGPGGVLAKR